MDQKRVEIRAKIHQELTERLLQETPQLRRFPIPLSLGQSAAINSIVHYVYMYQPGLAPARRPAGVSVERPIRDAKTRTVAAIAGLLHGSNKQLVKIDCVFPTGSALN